MRGDIFRYLQSVSELIAIMVEGIYNYTCDVGYVNLTAIRGDEPIFLDCKVDGAVCSNAVALESIDDMEDAINVMVVFRDGKSINIFDLEDSDALKICKVMDEILYNN